jgi:single-strand DNA-binding protein
MSSISKVTGSIIGYLGSEPRLTRVGDKGIARTFYCAVRNLRWSNAATGERQEKRVVLPLVSWGRQAENDARYLHKGSHVAIEFSIDNVRYEQDGENVFDFQFTVEAIQYLDSKAEAERRQTRTDDSRAVTSEQSGTTVTDQPVRG